MDLVATIHKEGSRGGRDAFKWSDVQQSTHRENYLGHSLMAPVGRWQHGRDLTWYTKHNAAAAPDNAAAGSVDSDDAERAAEAAAAARAEEVRRIKQAENEAFARALGTPIMPVVAGSMPASGIASNANAAPVREQQERGGGNRDGNRNGHRHRHSHRHHHRRDRSRERRRELYRDDHRNHRHRRDRDERDERYSRHSRRGRSRSRSRDRRQGQYGWSASPPRRRSRSLEGRRDRRRTYR